MSLRGKSVGREKHLSTFSFCFNPSWKLSAPLFSVKIPLRLNQITLVWHFNISSLHLKCFLFFQFIFLKSICTWKPSSPEAFGGTRPNKTLIHSLRSRLTLFLQMLILWFVENPTSCNWLLNFMCGHKRPADESQTKCIFMSFSRPLCVKWFVWIPAGQC